MALSVSLATCKKKQIPHLVIYNCTEENSFLSLGKHINSFRIALLIPASTIKQEKTSGPTFRYVCMGGQKG